MNIAIQQISKKNRMFYENLPSLPNWAVELPYTLDFSPGQYRVIDFHRPDHKRSLASWFFMVKISGQRRGPLENSDFGWVIICFSPKTTRLLGRYAMDIHYTPWQTCKTGRADHVYLRDYVDSGGYYARMEYIRE